MAGDLKSYFATVGKTALLTRQEEVELSKRIEAGDQKARDRMIRANIRLAISIAKNYANKNCDMEDLIQESSMGLIKAVDRFDYRRGFKFSTYACWWIKQAVRQYVAAHSGSIKLPAYARGILYKMRQVAEEYESEFGVPPSEKELADLLGTSAATLRSLVKSSASTLPLGASAFRSDPSSDRTLHDTLVDPDAVNPDEEIDRKRLVGVVRDALSNLTPREEIVLRLRFGISEDELDMATQQNN